MCGVLGHQAIGGDRFRRRLDRRLGDPSRRIENKPVDLVVMLGCVGAGDRRAPRPAHEVELRDASLGQNIIDRGAEVGASLLRSCDWLVRLGRLVHLRRTGRSTVRSDIDEVDVEAALSEPVHHRDAVDRQVEACFGWIRRAVNEKQRLVRGEGCHALRVLVAHVEFDARIGRRDHRFRGRQRRRLRESGARQR